jgi:signal transduction histidine kinase
MSSSRRSTSRWAAFVFLVVSCVGCAAGTAGSTKAVADPRQAERRQADLQRAARRVAGAIERDLGQAAIAFFGDVGPPPLDRRAFLIERLQEWQERDRAGLVSGLLLATRTRSGQVSLEETHTSDDAFHAVAWPDELRGLADELAAGGHGARPDSLVRPGAVVEKPLGVLLPLFGAAEAGAAQDPRRLSIDGVVVVLLDEAYLRERLLPRVVEAMLGPAPTRVVEVALLRREDRAVFYTSDPAVVGGDTQNGDVELPLRGRGRGPGFGPDFDAPPQGGDATRRDPPPPPRNDSPWLLVARHRGGTFEAAVASVQRRNLATGFGVLALLAATALVLVASAQRARRLARQQLEFVTGVTHELNTPLAAIRSAGQNLAAGIVTEPAQVRRYGELLDKEGARLAALVAQVLDFAGIESGSRVYAKEPLSLVSLLDEVVRDNRLVLEQAGMALEREVAPDLPELRGDAPALRRAIANLVTNAAKFAAAGRWIGIRATARPDGRAVVLRVEDRGPGIPREERERVFEPFYRGPAAERNATPGSGLGLSLVRHVVRAHGGSVRVEPRDGGGAALVVELPTPSVAPA